MSKRAAEDEEPQRLKAGERPVADTPLADGEEFEDEFEDEFESEDEILEAGVHGRPDDEREADERAAGAMEVLPVGSASVGGHFSSGRFCAAAAAC